MRTLLLTILSLFITIRISAQVGIGNTDPKAQLDITSGAVPSERDGILIPRMSEFPTGVTADQDGMMVFLNGNGTPEKGFYYYDSDLSSWTSVKGTDGGTLDDAYDFGGSGAGKTITATDGALTIDGTDGLLITGTTGSGNDISLFTDSSGMYFSPKKGAFRAGNAGNSGLFPWWEANTGLNSAAFNTGNMAAGLNTFAIGFESGAYGENSFAGGLNGSVFGDHSFAFNGDANGDNSFAFNGAVYGNNSFSINSNVSGHNSYGFGNGSIEGNHSFGGGSNFFVSGEYAFTYGDHTTALGDKSISIGSFTQANGLFSVAIGNTIEASGENSIAFGKQNTAFSAYETVFGLYATTYTPVSATNYDINDRLFSIGNGTMLSNRSNALTIYKSGLMNINDQYNMPLMDGTVGQIMTTDGNGDVSFQDPNTGTDNQLIDKFNLNGTILELSLEDDGVVDETVDLSLLQDADWYQFNTTAAPSSIDESIWTRNKVTIGTSNISNSSGKLNIRSFETGLSIRTDENIPGSRTAISNILEGNDNTYSAMINRIDGNLSKSGVSNIFGETSDSGVIGFSNTFNTSGDYNSSGLINTFSNNSMGDHTGVFNNFPGSSGGVANIIYGTRNSFLKESNNEQYGLYNYSNNISNVDKYGSYTKFLITSGGQHYGIYADVQKNNSYAAYFIGRTELGESSTNRYLMPDADGTNGQVMTTDGNGIITFQSVSSDDDQDLTPPTLTGTTLSLGIENGTGTSIDLASLEIDNQNLTTPTLTGTTLNLNIEDGTGTSIDLVSLVGSTLDDSYDYGGAGNGNTIIATDGAVKISGTDGFAVTGTYGSGDLILNSDAGTRMFFNPRKSAFRVGTDTGQWNDENVGTYSFGSGYLTTASGPYSIAMGRNTNATGYTSMALGYNNTANGRYAFVIGNGNSSPSLGETTIGINATSYTPQFDEAFGINDRIFSIGNGASAASRSNALTVYKSGLLNINDEYNLPLVDGSAGQVMTTDGNGSVTFQNNNDNQTIDTFNFNDATNVLTLELQDDGIGAQVVNLSTLDKNASNGLFTDGTNTIKLGGTLTENTEITFEEHNISWNLNNSGAFKIQDSGIDHWEINNAGDEVIGGGTYWRQDSTDGTLTARLTSNGDDATLDLRSNNSTTTRIRANGSTFFNGGNVGIGTSSPDYELSIGGELNLLEDGGTGSALRVDSAEALWYNGTYFSWGFGGSHNYFADDVGIGVNTPSFKLDVRDAANSNYIAQFYNTSTNANVDGLKIRLGRTTAPTGSNRFIGFFDGNGSLGTARGVIQGNGTGITYLTTSDRRLKTNIYDVNGALAIIDRYKTKDL